MPYAARTRVPISRTKTDIEELLAKHGATGFASALSWQTSVQSLPNDSRSGRYANQVWGQCGNRVSTTHFFRASLTVSRDHAYDLRAPLYLRYHLCNPTMESQPMLWIPSTVEFERAHLLLDLATKRGTRVPNGKPPPQPAEAMAVRREYVLGKHPNAKVRSLSAEYNCVGMVFGARRTVIEPEHVPMILDEDGYRRIHGDGDLKLGDVVVYKDDNDEIGHVGIVICIKAICDPPKRDITVLSQWGLHGEYFHDIDDVEPDYGGRKEFWTDRT